MTAITLDQAAKKELPWWIVTPDLTIFSNESKKGWLGSCQGIITGVQWSSVEKAWHVNVLKLETRKPAILSFTKFKTVLSYLLDMGGTPKKKCLIEISKEIWDYLI